MVLTPRRWRQVLRRCSRPTGLECAGYPRGDGGKQARSPGRARRKPLKPLRAGMPGDSGVLVVTRVRSTTTSAHEAAGATGIRHSPRPLGAENFLHDPGASRRGVAKACLPSLREAKRRSNPFFLCGDGLLRCARNDVIMQSPHSQSSSPANGSAEWPPDDRLQRVSGGTPRSPDTKSRKQPHAK